MTYSLLHHRAARTVAALLLTCLVSRGTAASAATVACGADAAQNTTDILCAGASTCSGTAVVVKENIDVPSGACVFDLGGRDLTFTKTLQVDGVTGSIEVDGAGAITIADAGKLKARGDFPSRAVPASGGTITLFAATTIEHNGVIDASGNPAGHVHLVAAGDVSLVGNAQVVVNGISNPNQGNHLAPAGEIEIQSTGGSVIDNGFLDLIGDADASGGTLHIEAAHDVTISKVVDATAGTVGGGTIELVAGDDVMVTKTIDVDSTQGGGNGGSITIEAGADQLGGMAPGGSVDVQSPVLLNGSSSQSASGDGGTLHVTAAGDIRFTGGNVSIHANAGASFSGSGGTIVFDTGDANQHVLGPLDGDIHLGGVVTTRGGASGGTGGAMTLTAGKDLLFDADTEMDGKDSGGDFDGTAGRSVTINRELQANATNVAGTSGNIVFIAGLAQNAGLTLKEDITVEAAAGLNGTGRKITLAGCSMTIESDTRVDADADTAVGSGTGGTIELLSRTPIQILPRAAFFARPGGMIVTTHPPGADPVIAGSASFNPARTDNATSSADFPPCGGAPGPTPSPTGTPLPGQLGLGDPSAAKAAGKCQQAIGSAAARFVAAKLKLLASCTDALFKCIQTKPEDGGKRAQCLDKARTKCDAGLRKIPAAATTLTSAVGTKCAAGGVDALRASNGLAFAQLDGDCGTLGSVAAVGACVAAKHACRADQIFDHAAPRARELMRVAGVAADALAPLVCLDDDGNDGLDLDREADAGKQVAKCARDVSKAAAAFAKRSVAGLQTCVGKIFGCAQTHPNDVAACVVPKVVSKCGAELARVETANAALRSAIVKSCGALDYPSLLAAADGMNLAEVDCGAASAPEFAACVAEGETCRIDALVRVAIPRSDELLGLFGLALPGDCGP